MPAYRLPEGVNLPERFLEDVLSIQESAAADAIKNVVATGRVLDSDRETLVTHMAMQLLRTRRQLHSVRELAEWTGTQRAQIYLNRRLEENDFESESERGLAEHTLRQLADGELRVGPQERALPGMSLSAFGRS